MPLDIAAGIFIALGASRIFDIGLSPWILLFAVVFSVLPDADFIVEWMRYGSVGGKVIREHRNLFHFPLTFIPVVAAIYFIFGGFWAALFGAAACFHLLHDSIGIGWGIKWWWPFRGRSYKFFADRDGSFSSRLLVYWEDKDLPEVVAKYGDPDWISSTYLRFTAVSAAEFTALLFALISLYFWWT